jgi:GNAT superfamily N-acetyltransferase
MRRHGIVVRDAVVADVPQLVELWAEARRAAGATARTMGSASETAVRARVERAACDPDARLVVAELEGSVVGVACVCREPVVPLEDEMAVRVPYLHVAESARRHGVGSALLAEAADHAAGCGAADVVVAVPPSLREANRFYARLALAPVSSHRWASTLALRRRLGGEVGPAPTDVLARRRRARAILAGGHSLRPVQVSRDAGLT